MVNPQERAAATVRHVVEQLGALLPALERMAPILQEFNDHRHVCEQCAAAWVSQGVTPPCAVGWKLILATVEAARDPEQRPARHGWRRLWRRA